jgi:hypothetical protein
MFQPIELYIKDVPTTLNSTMAMFADDTAVMAVGDCRILNHKTTISSK